MPDLLFFVGAAGLALLASSLRILREYERGVVFRLGRIIERKGPGLVMLIPLGIDRMVKVPLRIKVLDVPSQEVITRDNVSVKVNAVVYFRVSDPNTAVMEVEDYVFATSQLAQTTVRSVCGQSDMDHLLAERDQVNKIIRAIIDEGTDPWGIEVTAVEIKDIDLPENMRRAMAKQAEAERERRAKIIAAEGELQASEKLTEAARIMSAHPGALQLRYLQTLVEVAAENNSTTLFPLPIDLIAPFMDRARGAAAAPAPDKPALPDQLAALTTPSITMQGAAAPERAPATLDTE
jgi:regulator of protease activity HflC (stomatin/prohibitin superfamily)